MHQEEECCATVTDRKEDGVRRRLYVAEEPEIPAESGESGREEGKRKVKQGKGAKKRVGRNAKSKYNNLTIHYCR
jgi:hypothetical protein